LPKETGFRKKTLLAKKARKAGNRLKLFKKQPGSEPLKVQRQRKGSQKEPPYRNEPVKKYRRGARIKRKKERKAGICSLPGTRR